MGPGPESTGRGQGTQFRTLRATMNKIQTELRVGPGDNIQKSKTLIETTPTVFSGLIKEDFVKKKLSLKKTPPMAQNRFLVAFPYFKRKIFVKSTILISQKTRV